MDHSFSNLMEFMETIKCNTIESAFTYNKQVDELHRSISGRHNKVEQLHEAYYQDIAEENLKYDQLLLCRPTNTKIELHNY